MLLFCDAIARCGSMFCCISLMLWPLIVSICAFRWQLTKILSDLDEVWKVLGVSGCPQCLCKDHHFGDFDQTAPLRSFKESLAAIRTARRMLLERGNITAARKYLLEYRLSFMHTKIWNPFFLLPHTDFYCFPQDYLHTMYVQPYFWVCCIFMSATFLVLNRCIDAPRSDLGVTKLVVDAIRTWIISRHLIGTHATRELRQLSLRAQQLTALLPGKVEVYGLFLEDGPTLQGPHYRYFPVNPLSLHFDLALKTW